MIVGAAMSTKQRRSGQSDANHTSQTSSRKLLSVAIVEYVTGKIKIQAQARPL
jgi:DNA-directed RNA polymerase subunit K/omega